MMEDWTDIIGEELETIEEPLPADDWSVLQQKYAAARRRKKAAAFAWAGGITSVAAAVALVLLLVRPDVTSVTPDHTASVTPNHISSVTPGHTISVTSDHTASVIPDHTASVIPDHTASVIPDLIGDLTSHEDKTTSPIDTVPHADPTMQNNVPLVAENTEETFDVIRDTTSLNNKLLADASAQPTGTFGFDEFPEDEPRRKRRLMSIGISGSTSDSPIFGVYDSIQSGLPEMGPEPPYMDSKPPLSGDEPLPSDSLDVSPALPARLMKQSGQSYVDSYNHEIPISVGVSARINLTDRLSLNTGLNYTMYKSTRDRLFTTTYKRQTDKQYVHYLGVPLRLDYMAVNRKHFNLYFGAGLQMDKCVYAIVGDERLHEKQVLFGLNGAMGLQVNIVPLVGLYLEPEVSYALNDGSIETFRSEEPFVITFRGGLRLNF